MSLSTYILIHRMSSQKGLRRGSFLSLLITMSSCFLGPLAASVFWAHTLWRDKVPSASVLDGGCQWHVWSVLPDRFQGTPPSSLIPDPPSASWTHHLRPSQTNETPQGPLETLWLYSRVTSLLTEAHSSPPAEAGPLAEGGTYPELRCNGEVDGIPG